MTDELAELDDALAWIRISLLQAERFVESFLDFAESDTSDATKLNADGHFLLNACAQTEKALKLADAPLATGQTTTIRALRDVHEHWEQHKKSFESKKSIKTRAGLRFSEAHPEDLPWTFCIDATGTWISALRLEDLWEDLIKLEGELMRRMDALTGQTSALPGPARGPLPRRESKVLAMAIAMQNVALEFD